MLRGLRAQISLVITGLILITIVLISLLSNLLIDREFKKYIKKEQVIRSEEIVSNLSSQYNPSQQKWDISYVHGIGMYALYDGYLIKLYDADGSLVWDAENHNMRLSTQIMKEIETRMNTRYPKMKGKFISSEYKLEQNGKQIGRVSIGFFGPYFLSENDFRFLGTLNLVILIVGGLALTGALAAGYFLAKRISRPLVKTAQAASQIAKGDYDIRFEGMSRTRELEELVMAVNHLADSLNSQKILRKRLTADVAHELRTPLTAVSSHLEAMIEGVWEASPKRLLSCYEEIGRISGLVADLEQLAKVESEELKLDKVSVDLLELARQVCGNFESESMKKGITLKVSGKTSLVFGDRSRLSQVLTNLLSNGVKYTPEGGQVLVRAEPLGNRSMIVVEDNGIGISEEELPLVFERFYRTDQSRNRKTGGAGIGLTIAKSIVAAHGGEIKAEKNGEQGSRFTVILPAVMPGNAVK